MMFGIRSRLNSSGANRMISSTIRNIHVGSQYDQEYPRGIGYGQAQFTPVHSANLRKNLFRRCAFLFRLRRGCRFPENFLTPSEGVPFFCLFLTPSEGVKSPELPYSLCGPVFSCHTVSTPSEGVPFSHISLTPSEGVKSSGMPYSLCGPVFSFHTVSTPSEGVPFFRLFLTPSEGVKSSGLPYSLCGPFFLSRPFLLLRKELSVTVDCCA